MGGAVGSPNNQPAGSRARTKGFYSLPGPCGRLERGPVRGRARPRGRRGSEQQQTRAGRAPSASALEEDDKGRSAAAAAPFLFRQDSGTSGPSSRPSSQHSGSSSRTSPVRRAASVPNSNRRRRTRPDPVCADLFKSLWDFV
ncbi:hypothetical protein FQA47_017785 [Oryzias melastigma]|uniref:Uncharacterized protein n=1 Tax=Oryzias melastigma TaxID=30732 RepID=A0A834BT38_ORYME|nr:hypothetical protein FQA47_017785 [Oryzias melastigma]